jgi:hypothetical protein
MVVPANSAQTINICWCPINVGNHRVCLHVHSADYGHKYQVYLIGYACSGSGINVKDAGQVSYFIFYYSIFTYKQEMGKRKFPQTTTSAFAGDKRSAPLQSAANRLNVSHAPVSGKTKNHLRLVKPNTQLSASSYSISAHIARVDMYDECWMDKQERSFVKWLNFELLKNDFSQTMGSNDFKSSLGDYSRHLQMHHIKRLAFLLYQSDPCHVVFEKLKAEILSGRVAVKKELNFAADIGLRDDFIGLLLNYEPVWLVLALETVLGKAFTGYDFVSFLQKVNISNLIGIFNFCFRHFLLMIGKTSSIVSRWNNLLILKCY